MRKRVKRDIYASPLDFQRLHPDFEEQKAEPEMQVELHRGLGYVPAGGGPPLFCVSSPSAGSPILISRVWPESTKAENRTLTA